MGEVMTTQLEQFKGMEWIYESFSLVPRWTIEPDLEKIREVIKAVHPLAQDDVTVSFLNEGVFNKLYSIGNGKEEVILRVTLPIDPRWKTLSEAATLEWVHRNTNLPVPKVLAHEASQDNPIGFEWILMSKISGEPMKKIWRSMNFEAKEGITCKLANFSATIFKKQLRGIGNLYSISKSAKADGREAWEVNRIVSRQFIWGDHILEPVSRGPFRCSKDWLLAKLLLAEADSRAEMAIYREEGDRKGVKEARRDLKVIKRLKRLIIDVFPTRKMKKLLEPSMLFHDDLHMHNIMVDKAGALTGVVDWECVSALPLWKACNFPDFLQGPTRRHEPVMPAAMEQNGGYCSGYRSDSSADSDESDVFSSYWDNLLNYDRFRLRQCFLEELRRLEPGWIKVFETSERLRDFDLAVSYLPMAAPGVSIWMDSIKSGEEFSLHEWLFSYKKLEALFG